MASSNGNGEVRVANRVRPYLDPMDEVHVRTFVANLTSERMEVLRRQTGGQGDPRRSINAECGFPEGVIGQDLYRSMYERNPIAKRVVEVLPHESWQTQPQVYEDEDPKVSTPFEHAWDDLGRNIRGGSLYQDEEGSPIWEYLHRVDVLSGIGHFGLILLGIDDGKDLQEPVAGSITTNVRYANYETAMSEKERDHLLSKFPDDGKLISNMYQRDRQEQEHHAVENASTVRTSSGNDPFGPSPTSQMGTDAQYFGWYGKTEFQAEKPSTEKRSLMFLRVFPEYLVQVVRYEANLRNARFGQPVMYRITLNDPRDQHSGVGLPIASIYVHWSRVVHIADTYQGGASSSEVFGVPRQRPVMNHLMSLDKVYSAAGEAYWKACVNALAFNTHPQLGGDVEINLEDMRNQVENYQNSIQRFLTGKGGKWESIAPTVSDPTPHVTVLIEAICICIGCPIRIFKGSERGELASSQDDGAWNDRLKFRQYMYISPKIIVPFIDRLILLGILPQPKKKAADVVANWRRRGYVVRNGFYGGYEVYPPTRNAPTAVPSDNLTDKGADKNVYGKPSTGASPPNGPNPNATEISKPKPVAFVGGGGYSIQWKDLESNTQLDKANIANLRTTALAAYVSGGIENLMPEFEYLTHIMEFDDEEAKAIIDAKEKNIEDSLAEHSDLAKQGEEHDLQPIPPPGFENKPEPPPPLPGMEGGPPIPPQKLGAGQQLVHPETGKTIAKAPFPPKPQGTSRRGNPVKNEEDEIPTEFVERITNMGKDWRSRIEDKFREAAVEEWPTVFDREEVTNAFCPTGEGGGVDSSCSPSDSFGKGHYDALLKEIHADPKGAVEDKIKGAVEKMSKLSGSEIKSLIKEVGLSGNYSKKAAIEGIRQRLESQWESSLNTLFRRNAANVENCGGEGGTMGPCPGGGHLETLKTISDEFVKGSGTHAEMHGKVDEVLSGLSKDQLKEAAAKFGSRSAKGRKERVEGIKRFISDRREMLQRAKRVEEQ